MDTLWLIAGSTDAGNAELKRLKVKQMPDGTFVLPDSSARVVPVARDPDMRGRTVNATDVILVVGSWLGRRNHEVEWLVNQFNICRANDDAPYLTFKKDEAPIVAYPDARPEVMTFNGPMPVGPTGPVPSSPAMAGPNGPAGPSFPTSLPTYTLTINGANIPVTDIHLDTTANELIVVAATSPIKGEWVYDAKALRELVALSDKAIVAAQKHQEELEQWLSGVQPVEDSEIPGLYWCGCCQQRTTAHAEGCPVVGDGDSTLKS